MKTNKYILVAFAVLAMAACTKLDENGRLNQEETPTDVQTVSFKAVLGDDSGDPASKSVIGSNGSGKPQNFWEDGDEITVYSGNGVSASMDGYKFSTTLLANSSEADFEYNGGDWTEGTGYLAIYPAATAARTVNFTGEGDVYKMAAVDVPQYQTLVAGSFDKAAAVATAYTTGNTFSFKNAVALIKFRVSDSDIKGGSIVVDNADHISGRFRADLSTTEPYLPTLTVYSTNGVTQHNFVEFTIDGSTNLSTGVDYYVAVRPTALTSGFKVYLNGNLVKSFTSVQVERFARNKVYNLGTLSVPGSPAEKQLHFNFQKTPLTGWPTESNRTPAANNIENCVYPLYGVDYTFVAADCLGAAKSQVFWNPSSLVLTLNAGQRYLGFPVIPGYKLTKVVCHNKSGNTTAKFEVVNCIIQNTSDSPAGDQIVSAAQTWSTKDIRYVYSLTGTNASTMYYLYCVKAGSIGYAALTYVPD